MITMSKLATEAMERQITQGMRADAAAAAKKTGSNTIARVKGFKFPKRPAQFKMPSEK